MAITDWPADERPREKLLARGATALSDAELLAIFLRVGIRGQSAVDLARTLLSRFGSLTRMCSAGAQDFAAVPAWDWQSMPNCRRSWNCRGARCARP